MTTTDLYEVWGCAGTPPMTISKGPTGPRPGNSIPTPTTRTPATASASRRSAWPTRCSRIPSGGPATTATGPKGCSGRAGAGGAGDPFGGGLSDLFDAFFNGMGGPGAGGRGRRTGPVPGPDAEMVLRLTFREAVFGVPREVEVDTPGALRQLRGQRRTAGTAAVRCPDCQGAGELRRVRQSILGQVITAVPCPRCQGPASRSSVRARTAGAKGGGRAPDAHRGHPGRVDDGIDAAPGRPRPGRLPGRSERRALRPRLGGARRRFERSGVDLHATVHVPMTMAALGGSIAFETLDDTRDLAIAAGTKSGTVIP